jgi:EAL domain-containing protein (putative c-di-GMP-specific phosphodiesterase class I)
VDVLKIDAALSASASLVRTSVALGSALGMAVAAQGVEQAEQAVRLAALGCALGQGPLYRRAERAFGVPDLLTDERQRYVAA